MKGMGRNLAVLLFSLAGAMSLAAAGQTPAQQAETPAARAGVPVVVAGRELFVVQERTLSFSPEDRARAIAERIQRIAKEAPSRIKSIQVVEDESVSEIVLDELVIMTVTERDARAAGKPRAELAQEYAEKIRATALALHEEQSTRSLLLGALFAALATAALALALWLLAIGVRRAAAVLESWRGTRIRGIRLQRVELVSADRLTELLKVLVRAARVVAVLLLVYFYLPLVFSFFPWTRGYARVLFDYVLDPLRMLRDAIAGFLPNLFFILVISAASYYLLKLIRFLFQEVEKGRITISGFYPDWARPTYKIVRILLLAFTVIIIFPYLPGSQSPAFQGVSIFLGVLFSLGSTSAVSNMVAGTVLTYTRAFQVGDRVQIGEAMGDVVERTLLVTRLRTIKNVEISIPNSMVLASHVVNYSASAQKLGLILHTSVTIGYDVPWRTVHQLLTDAARATQHILQDPEPFVLQTSLNDFSVTYELNAYTDNPKAMTRIYSELHQNIQDKFNQAGVEILSPHYTALRDGNTLAIPSEHRPKGYTPGAFRIASITDSSRQTRE